MKLHILPVASEFQPDSQSFVAPPHNEQWNVETDFLAWLQAQSHYLTSDASDADWCYLPIFWNRYYVNNQWGQAGVQELQAEIDRLVSRDYPTFTVCEYDLAEVQRELDLRGMLVFTASRHGKWGIDIPLLCSPHTLPDELPDKRWLASFVGNAAPWGERTGMWDELGARDDCYLEDGDWGTEFFVNLMLESHIALAPRGHGGQSFRFYEAMQLGVVPLLIGEPDTRPFWRWIDWQACSLYLPSPHGLAELVDSVPVETLSQMACKAAQVYDEHLRYGQWCRYVIKSLERL